MVQHENYEIFVADISFALKEGDLDFDPDTELAFGTGESWKLENRLRKGDFVELVPDESKTVQKASEDSENIIGQLITNPEWTKEGKPMKPAQYGDYDNRRGTIRLFGSYVRELPLVDDNVDIVSGDVIGHSANGKFDKTTRDTKVIALEPKEALKSGDIKVLMGYFGDI